MSTVHIELHPYTTAGKIVIDGHDIAASVRALRFDAHAGRTAQLQLDLALHDTTRLGSAHVQVHLDPTTAEWLERAGWTPPPGVASVLVRREDGCPCQRVHAGGTAEFILGRIVPTCPVHGADAAGTP